MLWHAETGSHDLNTVNVKLSFRQFIPSSQYVQGLPCAWARKDGGGGGGGGCSGGGGGGSGTLLLKYNYVISNLV